MVRRLRLLVVLLVALVAAIGLSPGLASAAQRPTPPEQAMGWYLALGDSYAGGYQPDRGDDKTGGYAGLVLDAVRADAPKTTLINLACSGETTVTFLDGSHCAYDAGNQLAAAVEVLHAKRDRVRLITIDIGGNDARRCITATGVDQVCYADTLAQVGRNLTMILATLHAASPGTPIVVANYLNPYYALWLTGPAGQAFAHGSEQGIGMLNAVIARAAGTVGAPVADVFTAYQSSVWTPVDVLGQQVPLNVVRICQWTWMCTRQDIHPNDAGYAVYATAVIAALPAVRRAA